MDLIAKTKTSSNKPFLDPEFHKQLVQFHRKHSSISAISYYAISEQSEKKEEENLTEKKISENVTEDDMNKEEHSPSATHTDTGILTFIVNSDVPGLQVQSTGEKDFLEVQMR
eukprot:TRINITY_DN361_c0_g1_i4.p1 TRINITY_DN361_c0_g1~~TRINITY_DN361_c0_g1_i4.p1  ORF type:complete len:113 (-),score=33.37 TRINITY_DN361_c0_g1_i4:11-349(-)